MHKSKKAVYDALDKDFYELPKFSELSLGLEPFSIEPFGKVVQLYDALGKKNSIIFYTVIQNFLQL